MKNLIITFLFLSSLPSFAATDCIIEGKQTTLAEITKAPFKTREQTLSTFQKMHDCVLQHPEDRRIIFLDVYWTLTIGLFGLPEKQQFEDLVWYRKLLIGTAERYRKAFYEFEINDRENIPQIWLETYTSYLNPKLSKPLDLLLGMNSHITYDITLTLIDIETDFTNRKHYNDYRSLNPFFTEITPQLWDIVEHYEGKHRSEFHRKWKAAIVNKWIITNRLNSWDRAEEMDKFKNSITELNAYRNYLDQDAVKRGRRFLRQRSIIKSN